MPNCRRIILTAATAGMILFIFSNSLFPAAQSGVQSRYVLTLLDRLLGPLHPPFALTEHLVRKLAHVTEYAALGVLLTATVRAYGGGGLFLRLFLLLCVPAADEGIQTLTPGRSSQITDVWIDFFGGLCGTLLCALLTALSGYFRRARTDRKMKASGTPGAPEAPQNKQ